MRNKLNNILNILLQVILKIKRRRRKKYFLWIILISTFAIFLLSISNSVKYMYNNGNNNGNEEVKSNYIDETLLLTHNDSNKYNESTTTSTNTSSTPSKKPKLIIHIGPPKTGSTTIQCTLESLRPQLVQDNIQYIGRPECYNLPHIQSSFTKETKKLFQLFSHALVDGFDCHSQLIQWEQQQHQHQQQQQQQQQQEEEDQQEQQQNITSLLVPSCWNDFLQKLQYYHQSHQNVIFSDEAMSNRITQSVKYRPQLPYPWKALQSILHQMGWDVYILMVHRPLYDYLPSVYVEQYKYGPNKVKLRRWFRDSKSDSNCPEQGGRPIPKPFDTKQTTNEITIERLLEPNQNLYPLPAQVYEIVKRHTTTTSSHDWSIILVDMMMKEKDFIQYIICDALSFVTVHTCNAFIKGKEDTKNQNYIEQQQEQQQQEHLNPSTSLFYDFIATYACQNGYLNGTNLSRDKAQSSIQQYQEHTLHKSSLDFPLLCPSYEKYLYILNISLDNERKIQSFYCHNDNHHPHNNESSWSSLSSSSCWSEHNQLYHKEQFWKVVHDKKKFCTVDSSSVLKDVKWINFFSQMKY